MDITEKISNNTLTYISIISGLIVILSSAYSYYKESKSEEIQKVSFRFV